MKNQTEKKMLLLQVGLVLAFGLGLIGCVETTSPLCDRTNAFDVPGFEGQHSIAMYDASFKAIQQSFEIVRQGFGEYAIAGSPSTLKTCKVGNLLIGETQTEFGTYKPQLLIQNREQGFTLTTPTLSIDLLQELGVSYSIVERTKSTKLAKLAKLVGLDQDKEQKEKVLVIDNSSSQTTAIIGKYALPHYISMSYK